jgi:hypothetical protein
MMVHVQVICLLPPTYTVYITFINPNNEMRMQKEINDIQDTGDNW